MTARDAPFAEVLATIGDLLAAALEWRGSRTTPASPLDPWEGLGASLARRLDAGDGDGEPAAQGLASCLGAMARRHPAIAKAARWLELPDEDIAIVALVLAPEADPRFGRAFASLQGDPARRHPDAELLAAMLRDRAEERTAILDRLAPGAPLVAAGVLEREAAGCEAAFAQPVRLDSPWRAFLLGAEAADARLDAFARLVVPAGPGLDRTPMEEGTREVLRAMVASAAAAQHDLRLVLVGPNGAGKAAMAAALAQALGLRLLVLDLRELSTAREVLATLARARTACALAGALLYVHGAGALAQRDPQLPRALAEALASFRAWFVLSLAAPLPQMHTPPIRARFLDVALPGAGVRLAAWRAELARQHVSADDAEVEQVAARFRLSAAQIAQAVGDTAGSAVPFPGRRATGAELAAAARRRGGDELARLAQRISPEAAFDALVVPGEVERQLREICTRVALRDVVRAGWTRDCVHARATGVTALFAGPSGTGKTFAAEVIARELGLDLFRIDLSAVVSKYIGETEKNLDRVFAAAENANAVLFFDEADALFGKRSEVKDAHDRYANIEIAYLLQKMEQFDGLAILATNLRQNLDDAFARRLTFCVQFPFPEETERRRLWEALWPPHAPRADDVEFGALAGEFAMSGGNIRNTVLAAAHLAAANGQVITREHLLDATRREFQKLGKHLVTPPAAGGHA